MKEANRVVIDRGSLPELLINRARQATDRRLVIDAAVGLIAAAGIAVLRPPLWLPLSALAFCLGAFGLWGILDREASEAFDHGKSVRGLTWSMALIAIAGGAAALVFGVSLFFGVLGQWIS